MAPHATLFPVSAKPTGRPVRPPSTVDLDLTYFRSTYEAHHGHPLVRATARSWIEDRKHLKRLAEVLPDQATRHAFLAAYAEDTNPFVIEHGHLLRYAMQEWRFQQLKRAAERAVDIVVREAALTRPAPSEPTPEERARIHARWQQQQQQRPSPPRRDTTDLVAKFKAAQEAYHARQVRRGA
jgi:hypothetical protein